MLTMVAVLPEPPLLVPAAFDVRVTAAPTTADVAVQHHLALRIPPT